MHTKVDSDSEYQGKLGLTSIPVHYTEYLCKNIGWSCQENKYMGK